MLFSCLTGHKIREYHRKVRNKKKKRNGYLTYSFSRTAVMEALEQVQELPGTVTAARRETPGEQEQADTALNRQKKLLTQGLNVHPKRHLPATSSSRE